MSEHGFAKGRTSTGSGVWRTPPDVLHDLSQISGWAWALDCAATSVDRVCEEYVGPDHPQIARRDALALPPGLLSRWLPRGGAAWCNPPYDVWGEFAHLLAVEAYTTGLRSCLLVFARTDTAAWHRAMPNVTALAFRAGRVSFVDAATSAPGGSAPAPSVALFFGPWTGLRGALPPGGATTRALHARWHVVTP